MRYPIVLLDLDHTLLDSTASEAAAFAETVRSVGLEPQPHLFRSYSRINKALWAAVERGETTPVQVGVTRFEEFAEVLRIEAAAANADGPEPEADPFEPEAMASVFAAGLGNNGELYPDARTVLEELSGVARLAMVTNGLSEVQRRRIERLELAQYFEVVVISAEVGTSKPGTTIFDITFEQLGALERLSTPDRSSVLMVGDSLTSDIQGGCNAGVDTCLYAPQPPTESGLHPTPTHVIGSLVELLPLVKG